MTSDGERVTRSLLGGGDGAAPDSGGGDTSPPVVYRASGRVSR
ncbi:hypothetical protein [Xylanimonas oleitrophica]|nr:hypothetical protein [Xylanimonas oleitrophica]